MISDHHSKTLSIQCKKCTHEFVGKFCPECGLAVHFDRIDRAYILKEISSVLNFDKGFLYSVKELLIRPGESVRHFIKEDRARLVKPIIFILVSSLLYMLANKWFHFEDGYVNIQTISETTSAKMLHWLQNNYGYGNIIMGFFIAFWIQMMFRKYDYNFFEVLILLCFVMGVGMLMYTAFGIVEGLSGFRILHLGGFIGITYSSWAIGSFFDKSKKKNYFKGFVAYIMGMVSAGLTFLLLGIMIDMFLKA